MTCLYKLFFLNLKLNIMEYYHYYYYYYSLAVESVNTWLWFKVLQVDLILVFIDVLMPAHHHNRKLKL